MNVNGHTKLYGILGDPVEHTLSPAMQNAAFDAVGLNAVYLPLPVKPRQLRRALLALTALGFGGVNLTVPHKERALAVMDQLTPRARRIGAVNTVVIRGGRLIGDNTDGDGFLRAVGEAGGLVRGGSAVVLGAGGAARAVAMALAGGGCGWMRKPHRALLRTGCRRLTIANRTAARAQRLAAAVRRAGARAVAEGVPLRSRRLAEAVRQADIVVNATSVGWRGEQNLLEPSWLHRGQLVVDLVYRPGGTPLLAAARRRGARTQDGLAMLLHQGALAFERWTGRRAPLAAMRRALRQAVR